MRELKNVVERIVTLAPDDSILGVDMLPQEISNKSSVQLQKYKSTGTLYEAQKQLEIEMIMDALKTAEGNPGPQNSWESAGRCCMRNWRHIKFHSADVFMFRDFKVAEYLICGFICRTIRKKHYPWRKDNKSLHN